MTKDGFLAEAKELQGYTRSHSQLCADYINQFWLERDGRVANARVWLFDENDDDGRHIIISDMKNGYPPDDRTTWAVEPDGCQRAATNDFGRLPEVRFANGSSTASD